MLIEKQTKYDPLDWVWFWHKEQDKAVRAEIEYIQLFVAKNRHPAREDRIFIAHRYFIDGKFYSEFELFDNEKLLEINRNIF